MKLRPHENCVFGPVFFLEGGTRGQASASSGRKPPWHGRFREGARTQGSGPADPKPTAAAAALASPNPALRRPQGQAPRLRPLRSEAVYASALVARRSVSIIDVAAAANVGVGTVSRALNGGSVKQTTREKIERAVAELGYVPSQMARNLKLNRTGIIGLVAETSQASWFVQFLHGVEVGLREHAASVALCSLRLTGEYDASPVEAWIRERRVDGLIFVRSGRRERVLVKAALEAELSVSLVVPDEAVRGSVVFRLDNERGGELAGQHLHALGHRTVGFLGGPEASVDTQGRLRGLKRSPLVLSRHHEVFAPDYSVASGDRAAARFMEWYRRKRAPSAVVLANDAMALGFIRTVQAAGLNVPEDVSVAGFDGVPEGALSNPPLTSIAQPITQMGIDACRAILEPEKARMNRRYPMHLLQRKSTAPPSPSKS